MKTYQAIAELYDDEYAELDMLHRDVGFYLDQLPRRKQSILSLACGTGRDAIPLAQAHHNVVGVDLFEDMLAIARHKQSVCGIDDKQLRFVKQDLLKLKLNRSFDHAVCLFNGLLVFTTLPEQDRVLQNIRRHLKPGGTLWFDVFNPESARVFVDREEAIQPEVFFSRSLGTTVVRTTTLWRDKVRPHVRHTQFNYSWHEASGRKRASRVHFEVTWFMPREMVMLLERNGFEMISLWGDYDGSAITVDSPRVIAWARKKGR
jgi:ubiquinone/menaquinone biosynthesis C-methylase UbiE